MPPKRKRGAAAAAAAAAEAAAAPAESDNDTCFIETICNEWKTIAGSKSRCQDLWINLSESHSPLATEGYWLQLATLAMNRMTLALTKSKSASATTCTCLAQLSYNVIQSLDKCSNNKLDRIARKPLVGRTLLTLAVSSLTALEHAVKHGTEHGNVLWAAALALDMVIGSTSSHKTSLDGWHMTLAAISNQAAVLEMMEEYADVTTALNITDKEQALLQALLRHNPDASPSKRARRPKKAATPTDDLATAFETLFSESALEARMTLRRWGSMAFVWLAKGQERTLLLCHTLLQNMDQWAPVLECPPQKKTKKLAKFIHVPGTVAVVTLVTRLVSIVAEASSHSGSIAPSGGMDAYVQRHLLVGSKKVVSRPDVRDLSVVTMHALITTAHAHDDASSKKEIQNDDDTEGCAVVDGVARYCPHVHKAVESLCRNSALSSQSVRKLLTLAACHVLQQGTMDAKLCSFAISQFNHSFGCHDVGDDGDDDDALFTEPLPEPTMPKKSRKSKRGDEDDCTYAGILADLPKDGLLDKILLPYFFRATPPAELFTIFLNVLEACYDTGPAKPKKSKKKKRAAAVALRPRRLNAIRAGLASDVCNALRACLTIDTTSVFRKHFTAEQGRRFVQLSRTLDSILTTSANETKKDTAASFFHPSASDFNLYERTLWSSHSNLCFVVGRGTLLHDSKRVERTTPPLVPNDARLVICQEMCGDDDDDNWPLHLPASHHAVLAANLTSEPIMEEAQVEDFIAQKLIASITSVIQDPSIVMHANWYGEGDLERTTDERHPLSIRDGRLLLVAISRLAHKRQLEHVSTLAKALQGLENPGANPQVSQFLARVVTVYAGLLNLVMVGKPLRDKLFDQVGPCQYQLPALYTVQKIVDGSASKEGNWYKRESCYMGLFSDWESPVVPSCSSTPKSLPKDLIRRSKAILEEALGLGFECARGDFGQLLFSAWNAAGRTLTWDSSGMADMKIDPFDASNLPRLFLSLRQDICKIFFQVSSSSRTVPDSLLGQTMKNVTTRRRSIKETLNTMLEKASNAVDHLMDDKGDGAAFSDIELALLEGIPVYVAFCMAMHTKTSETIFARSTGKRKKRKRNRRRLQQAAGGYDIELLASIMSDDDSMNSEEDYDYQEGSEDCKIDALARLHDACSGFGAAPMHPDWLDDTCCFREGVNAADAGRNAAKALDCLTKLGALANAQHSSAIKNCMAVLAGQESEASDTAAILSCIAIDTANGILSDCDAQKESDFQKAVASVFDMSPVVVQDFYNDSAGTGWRAAKEAWIPNAPQQIVGLMQSQSIDGLEASNSEYRAGGEWEMLLSESLAGACTGCGMDDSDHDMWKSFPSSDREKIEQVFSAYIQEERWLRISQGVVSQLMPTAALLRFSATSGHGRETHPLCIRDSTPKSSVICTSSAELALLQEAALSDEAHCALRNCVSFLACRSTRSNGDDISKRSCSAVASNLLVDPKCFSDVEGIEALSQAFEILESLKDISPRTKSFQQVAELLIVMIRKRGNSSTLSNAHPGHESCPVLRLVAYLCSGTLLDVSILGATKLELSQLFADESAERNQALGSLLHLLTSNSDNCSSSIATMLGQVTEIQGSMTPVSEDPLAGALMTTLQSLDATRLKTLVELAFSESPETVIGVCKTLAYALRGTKKSSKFCSKLYSQLSSCKKIVEDSEARESCLGLLFLYACRVGSLDKAGSSFMKNLGSMNESDMVPLECLLSFVQGVRLAMEAAGDAMNVDAASPAPGEPGDCAQAPPAPRACSHVLRNGFFQQHWYNCYTCGLVFDKGCCTICALTCHKGHEVAYSRFSSFFCDCGAEVESAGEQNRVVCKCITEMSQEDADKVFREDIAKTPLIMKTSDASSADAPRNQAQARRALDLFIDVASTFEKDASSEVEKIKAVASKSSWVRTIFDLITDQSQEIMSQGSDVHLAPAQLTKESVAFALAARCGTTLEFEPWETDMNLVPIRAARAGTLNVKMSVDSTTDRLKRAMLSRHSIVRSVVVADSRGRLIVAEPCSLIFCTAIPAINTRYMEDALTSQAGRPQMSIFASHPLAFNIVGMRLNKDNERHLVVWGTSEASVVILKNKWAGVERTINLDFDLDPHDCESDYLLRCDWVPGSQTHVSVACGTFVKVYDITSADGDDNVSPLLSYSIAYEAVVKDIAWVSLAPALSGNKKPDPSKRKLLLYLLTDTGKIHEIKLQTDSTGDIDGQGSSYLERSSRCIDIPTAGVHTYEGVSAGKAGSSTRSLGEGCTLTYLPRCKLLLYKCVSSCVVALSIDETGEITGSFEILPNRVDAEVLGNDLESYSIVGPFVHWTEMGIMEDGYFRLVCVGRSSRTSQPKMLCIDVNEETARVKEIAWATGGSVGLGLSLSSSYEGLVPFSAPILKDKSFVERLYLCAITSNGSVLIYGEDMEVQTEVAKKPPMPLTLYEELLHVSEVDVLRFTGDGIGNDSDNIKAKLSSKNSIYLMSPSRDGCTITVTLDGPVETSKLTELESPPTPGDSPSAKVEATPPEELVIVAFRLLVGSTTTDCLPSRVFVQGRPVKLVPDTKRWYDLPLTTEEIVMAVRNGFVSIGLGSPFESGNNPLIDAVEVYAVEKKKLQSMIPQALETTQVVRSPAEKKDGESDLTKTLVLTTKILSSLYQIVDASLDQDTPEGKSLKGLIRSTALREDRSIRESIVELLEGVESDYDARQKFLDEGTIIGMSEALQKAHDRIQTDPDQLMEQLMGRKLKALLETSLKSATSIALSRPENYVSATEQLTSEGLAARSIALDASEILVFAIRQPGVQYRDVLENVVHLVLAELSISKSHTESAEGEFATFGIIAKLLRHPDNAIVERCCEAITSFVETHSPTVVNPMADLFNASDTDRNEQSAPIAYQCDSCSLFPITDTRYTPLDDDHDIDLCTKCYQLARVYADSKEFSANEPLIINGRSIGGATKLSCAQMSQMQSVPIADGPAIAVHVEQARQEAKSAGARAPVDADDPLSRALLLSHAPETPKSHKIVINFDTFTDGLFDNILGHVGGMLDGSTTGIPIARINPLLTLLLESIRMGANESAHIARGKRYAREVMKHTRRIIGAIRGGSRAEKSRYVLLINFLRSLSRLTGGNDDEMVGIGDDVSESGGPPATPNSAGAAPEASAASPPSKSKGKTDPRFVCDAHGVPAVRRRCSGGVNKNRRFYVCGMERKLRCKYFKWADDPKPARRERSGPPSRFEKEMEVVMWQLLSDITSNAQSALNDQLCDLLEAELSISDPGKELRPSEVKSSADQPIETSKAEISSIYDRDAAVEDLHDGVFCSQEKVRGVASLWLCKQDLQHPPRELLLPEDESDDQKLADKFIEASLDLVSTVASTSSTGKSKMPGQPRWFSLLCEVISMNPPSRFRGQAKRALKRMCGGNRSVYHSVRDYYVFGFQFKEVLHYASSALEGALCVHEQARQCGEHWKENEVTWDDLPAGGLLGTLDLVSEDALTVSNSRRISSILDQLMSVVKSRGGNWRHFCSLQKLPPSRRQRAGVMHFGQERVDIEDSFGGPPILSLFWLSCMLSGPNQVKVMKMIDVALASAQERKRLSAAQVKGSVEIIEATGDTPDNADPMEIDTEDVQVPLNSAPQKMPELTLLKSGKISLSGSDIVAFSLEFVLRGRTAELRRIASQVAIKLCRHIDDDSLVSVFNLLVDKPMVEIGGLGCASVQYLQLMQSLVKFGESNDSLELSHIAQKVAQAFTHQMNLFKLIGGKGQFSLEGARDSSMKRFDMSQCVYCHRVHPHQKSGHGKSSSQSKEKKSSRESARNKSSGGEKADAATKPTGPQWLPEQVRPFTKGRLEPSTDNTCSSEFAFFVQLKCRLSISEVHMSATEPRGRYAKTIVVYFTPRPVSEVNQLKSEDYEDLWQECGTITLARGSTRAVCQLSVPVTAANLKFEYRDFYDRSGGSRPSDGGFVLFCPRCSRQVNNAHGVCGNCGECVFQCRRCRHIQYDRPDAFLCTECGHCSSGTFSFELTAGVASNAVAVVDDESHARAVKVSRAATKLHSELQSTLVERLRKAIRKRSHSEDDPLSEYSPALKRALMGDLPKLGAEDDASTAGASNEARGSSGNSGSRECRSSSNAANRARSLLRLARQLRNDGGDRGGGRSRELLVREAFFGGSREFSLEEVDGEGADIVGLFGGNTDRDDPLTRLVATISGRRGERNASNANRSSGNAAATTSGSKKESNKSSVAECEKLYQLMREAERECHEIQRRLDAWFRLENNRLPETAEEDEPFAPTKCTRCAGPVTLHLLLLMLRLFQSNKIEEIESVITKGFVRSLFLEPAQMHKDLFELKRMAITTFCTKSEHAAKLVLDELRARLKASSDGPSAAILGKLLEHPGDFPLSDKFVTLATETLEDSFMF